MSPRRAAARDEGSITVLTIGLVAVLLAAVVAVASITHLQLQRSRLAHVADETALAAADAIDLDAYYRDGASDGAPPPLDPDRITSEAGAHFSQAARRNGLDGAVLIAASSPDGATVEVTVGLRSPLLFDAGWLPGAVDLTATASARASVP